MHYCSDTHNVQKERIPKDNMIIRRHILLLLCFIGISSIGHAQSSIVKDFKPVCDSLNTLIMKRKGIESPKVSLNAVMKRGNTLDFYFTQSLSDCPWHEGDPEWFRRQLCGCKSRKYP